MTLEIDLDGVDEDSVDFVVAEGSGKTPKLGSIRVDQGIRTSLVTAARTTYQAMLAITPDPKNYDPSNEYPPNDHLYLSLGDETLAAKPRLILGSINHDEITNPLEVLPKISLYCARMTDSAGHVLWAVKKTSDFGRMLKRPRVMRFLGAGLQLVDEPEFQLSSDFDFLIDSTGVYIYRPKPFETACNLQSAIKESIGANVAYISAQVGFIDFTVIEAVSSDSVRSSRLLASIKANDYGKNLNADRVVHYCDRFNVSYKVENNQLVVDPKHAVLFLRILARQHLEIELIAGLIESFYASNRQSLS